MKEACELCAAIHESRVITKNASAFAIICQSPLKPEHVLIMPIKHATTLNDLDEKEAKDFLFLVEEMKKTIKKKAKIDVLVVQNSGAHSTEPHIHFHVLPSQGSLHALVSNFENIPRRLPKSSEELTKFAEEIKIHLCSSQHTKQ